MACFLPFRPWHYPDLRVFDRRAAWRTRILITKPHLSCTSTPPQRLHPTQAAHLQTSHADHEPFSASTSLSSRPFSISGSKRPSCSLPFESVRPVLPSGSEVPLSGFGYPLSDSTLQALGNSFSSQRSWVSPFGAFLRPDDSRPIFSTPLRSRAFPQNLAALCRRPNGLIPSSQPCPFTLPRELTWDRAELLP